MVFGVSEPISAQPLPPETPSELINLVSDAALSLSEIINHSPPSQARLYRGLKRGLAYLILEIKSNEIHRALLHRRHLAELLSALAGSISDSLKGSLVRDAYQREVCEQGKDKSTFLSLFSWVGTRSPEEMSTELGNKWTGSPFPVLGMFCDLNHSSIVQKVDLIGFLNNDVQVLQGLLATIGKWNEAADAIFTTDGLDIDMGEDDKTYPISGIDYTSMSGPTSVRRLSTALYDVLHSNWPCNVAEHDHNGKLGECYEANFYLDPHWISGNATGDGLFIVLRAPGLLQESRVCLHNSAALETHTPACLTSHEDSHPFCLHFTVDGESQLWDQQQLVRPLEVFHPEHDYVGQDLRDLFSSFRPAYTTKRVLGVILARTVLHLFEGPWMNSHMSIEDFAIFCRRDNGETDPSFDKLFLSTKFQSGQNANTPSRRGYSVHPFPTILALGIVLMQIELADDLEDLYTEPWFGNLQHRPFDLAKRLLQQCQLRLHMGSGMVRAARFCTDRTSLASFTRSNSDRLFSTPDFTKAYYQNIVRPLEDDLVSGASWSWAEVQQLKPFNSDNTTYLKVRSQRVPLAVQPRDTRETSGSSSQKCKHGFHKPATRLPTLSDDHMGELSATYGDIPKGDTSKSVSFRSLKHSVASENAPVSVDSISRQKMALDHTLSSRFPKKPQNRDEFEIAIICALPKEADAVISIFDQVWDEDYCAYGKASNDPNSYTAGVIGGHNVVVAHQSHMGKANAATVASKCTMSFTKVKLAFVVGICGGAPRHAETNEEILLGDVVISKGVIQYDFGRQYPSQMVRKIAVEDVLGRPNAEVGSILAKLETVYHRTSLENNVWENLDSLDQDSLCYPGPDTDQLFPALYHHQHRQPSMCHVCCMTVDGITPVCEKAMISSCEVLKCHEGGTSFVPRSRKNQRNRPNVHIGLVASGDSVIKSGILRDRLSDETKTIAFEMEGAGVWGNFPSVIIIKGVCDYADSHKSKEWQTYAASTAAACMKAFLRHWNVSSN